jgi:hypothetical protein
VQEGEGFRVVARQITTAFGQQAPPPPPPIGLDADAAEATRESVVWRRVVGSFQITIPVAPKGALLRPEARLLSVLRWIFKAIPTQNRWHPVFVRYLDQVADRVDALGGDPDAIVPSSTGLGGDPPGRRCRLLGWLTALLLAGLVIVAAAHPIAGYVAELLFGAATLVAAGVWWRQCTPSKCRLLAAGIVGVAGGAAVVAIAWLAGWVHHRGALTLAAAALALAVLVLTAVWKRCLRFRR